MVISSGEMLVRMGAAILLSAAIGYERERSGRPAGLRTHLLVGLASATFMLVSTQFVYFQRYTKDDLVIVDTSRIAASVVTGIGFLGAGAILKTGISVQGLTTAASLWLVASVGLAAGGGMYLVAVASTAASLFSLIALRRIEGRPWRIVRRQVVVVLGDGRLSRTELVRQLRDMGVIGADVDYDVHIREDTLRLQFDVRLPNRQALERILAQLEGLPGVRDVQMRRSGS